MDIEVPAGHPDFDDQEETMSFLLFSYQDLHKQIRKILGDVPSDRLIGGKRVMMPYPLIDFNGVMPRLLPMSHKIYPWKFATCIKKLTLVKRMGEGRDGFQSGRYEFLVIYTNLDYDVREHLRP